METKIEKFDNMFLLFIDGEHEDTFETKDEAEDRRDYILKDEHDYFCQWCEEYSMEEDVFYKAEDVRFTCYSGDMTIISGSQDYKAVCPNCDEELEVL